MFYYDHTMEENIIMNVISEPNMKKTFLNVEDVDYNPPERIRGYFSFHYMNFWAYVFCCFFEI